MLISYWHAQLQFTARTNMKLVAFDCSPGVYQSDVSSSNSDSSEDAWVGEAGTGDYS